MTFGYEIEIEGRGERIFSLDGTPPIAWWRGLPMLKDKRPDIVLSGVNRGQNLGDIMHCSETAAGAREGALHAP